MPKVTLQDIADAVGVSRMTVSNAFNRPESFLRHCARRSCRPRPSSATAAPTPAPERWPGEGRAPSDCSCCYFGQAFRDPVSTEFLVAVGDALAEKSLALTLVATAGDNPPMGRDLPMDGAIVFVRDPRVDLEWLRHRGTPVVTVDQAPTNGVPAINVDDAGGARAAAQHLVDLGHRRIGIVTVGEDLTGRIRPADQRLVRWREALGAAGVEPVVAHANPRPVTAAYDAALELLHRPDRPTALLCFSDVFAAQAIRAAEDLGLNVPADVSVVGYDDADCLDDSPRAHHGAPTGRREGAHRRRRAAGPDRRRGPQPHTVLRTELVIRESTAPVPSGRPAPGLAP